LLGFRSTARAFGAVLSPLNGRTAWTACEIRGKLDEAARIAKAAEASASTGAIAEGVAVPWISNKCDL
jgi:hypothetical protein